MNKYTIKNIFEKGFPFPIWKIEVDCSSDSLVVEYRDPDTTLPYFAILALDGTPKCADIAIDEKEWTLESLQGEHLVLKRFGTSSPIEAGIRIIHYPTGVDVCHYMEYIITDVYKGTLIARHRSVPGGLLYAIDISTGEVTLRQTSAALQYPPSDIRYPISYRGHLPAFIRDIPYVEHIWLLPLPDHFIWAYHLENEGKYDLHLQVSSRNEAIDHKIVLNTLDRLIPQPFFQIKGYVFFLSNCKLKIKGYLV